MSEILQGFLHIKLSDDTLEKAKQHVQDFKDVPPPARVCEVVIQYRGQEVELSMSEFIEAVGLFSNVCMNCNGDGEVSKTEAVYPGEPHMADIGTEACPDCDGTGRQEYE
jgi:hypothetical protein